MEIISISADTNERYTELISGVEQPAPLLAVYKMKIVVRGETYSVKAEVRSSPHGEQIDWDDELNFTESEGAKALSEIIYEHFCNNPPKVPAILRGGYIDLESQ